MTRLYTFRKKERLCSQRFIGMLYASPQRTMVFPLSIHWTFVENGVLPCRLQTVIVAPKKKLHHAVDRNRAKRLMRECYRLRKQQLIDILEQQDKSLILGINYIHNEVMSFQQLSNRFDKLLPLLINQLRQPDTQTSSQETSQ